MAIYGVPAPGEGTRRGTSPEPGSTAQLRAPARSTRAAAPSTSPEEDVHDAMAVEAAPEFGAWLTAALDKSGTLLHDRPPSFRQAHARHAECASHHQWAAARAGRMLFGYVHMAFVKPALNYLEWATDSPLRLTIHALLGAAVWLALQLGGYL